MSSVHMYSLFCNESSCELSVNKLVIAKRNFQYRPTLLDEVLIILMCFSYHTGVFLKIEQLTFLIAQIRYLTTLNYYISNNYFTSTIINIFVSIVL